MGHDKLDQAIQSLAHMRTLVGEEDDCRKDVVGTLIQSGIRAFIKADKLPSALSLVTE